MLEHTRCAIRVTAIVISGLGFLIPIVHSNRSSVLWRAKRAPARGAK